MSATWPPVSRAGGPAPPTEITAEVPVASGPEEVGAVLLLGRGKADAGEYLHMAALAALTELAVVEAREEAERALRGSFLEELLSTPEMEPEAIERRARLLGCDLSTGAVGMCADPGERSPGLALATISNEVAGAIAQSVGSKVYAILPGLARARVARLRRASASTRRSASRRTTRTPATCAARSRRPSSCSRCSRAAARTRPTWATAPTGCCSA